MIIIIHHLQSEFDEGLLSRTGKDAVDIGCELARAIKRMVSRSHVSKVILTQFEDWEAKTEHYESGIADFVTDWREYGYGWRQDELSNDMIEGKDYCYGGFNSEVVLLPDWMHEIKKSRQHVLLCGAFDGECIEDMEIALKHCKIPYRRWEKFIV